MAPDNRRRQRKARQAQRLSWVMPAHFSTERPWADPDDHGVGPLHQERLNVIVEHIGKHRDSARRLGDLGCGAGALVQRLLALDHVDKVLGVDVSAQALQRIRAHPSCASALNSGRLELHAASYLEDDLSPFNLDTLILLETIEHLPPSRLSALEHQVFMASSVRHVLITTPNGDFNPLLGLPAGRLRHPDHRFEWGRAKFLAWAQGLALRHGFEVCVHGVGPFDEVLGTPTQLAVFVR